MATTNHAHSASSSLPYRAANYQPQVPISNAPAGTFAPGTKVQVGSHRVIIEKYLSEGGFAHVYVVRVPTNNGKHEVAVLKRVAVPDKEALANMRTEVETMKKLKGHKHIVTYIDSHASQLKGGGYEVFLVMEFCAGGGLIDFMNTRLQHRLTEPEILNIFSDVSEGVATMHYLKPPLLHRDLKVENVLISKTASSSGALYKLCDFGSTAPPRPAATNASEGRLIEDDIQRHTTLQYRSPEMVDVWRRQPIDEKSDIWALGVLLYKLCYYTTPFEEVGQMAILNASFKYPHHPPFSERLKKLIGSMLKEDPKQRPNIFQVVKETCSMRGTAVPIKDIYSSRSQSEARGNQELPPTSPQVSSPPAGAGISLAPPLQQKQVLPDIAPMRRGRPTAPAPSSTAQKPSPSPAKGDPFAALDSKSYQVRAGAVDQLASKYPSLDEFSIVHDKKGAFQFPAAAPSSRPENAVDDRKVNALADEVFARPSSSRTSPARSQPQPETNSRTASLRKGEKVDRKADVSVIHQPVPVRSSYTSTGTMTSASPPPPKVQQIPEFKRGSIWRVPSHSRSSSQPRPSFSTQSAANALKPSLPPIQRAAIVDSHRSRSQTGTDATANPSTSSRPSLEGRRPSEFEVNSGITRARSANFKAKTTSEAHVDSDLDFLREKEKGTSSRQRPSLDKRGSSKNANDTAESAIDDTAIENDTDYLRSIEDSRQNRKSSDGHKKRASMPALSLSGTKNAIAGKFGDAFKRFEHSGEENSKDVGRDASPRPHRFDDQQLLSPIAGSEATSSPPRAMYGSEASLEETEDLPPEVRRELERQRLIAEERRVAEAAAEYKNRAGTGPPSNNRASTIQKRVQSLLEERAHSPVPRKTAEGYGRYTDAPVVGSGTDSTYERASGTQRVPPSIARKPVMPSSAGNRNSEIPRSQQLVMAQQSVGIPPVTSSSAPPMQTRPPPRPSAPPKPRALRTGTSVHNQIQPPPAGSSQQAFPTSTSTTPASAKSDQGSRLAALLARDQEGVAAAGTGSRTEPESDVGQDTSYQAPNDWDDFSKRYPSLSEIEMVEAEIGGGLNAVNPRRGIRIKDV